MPTYIKEYETLIPAPLSEVFEFFSNAENLQLLTPSNLHFKILSPLPIEMKPGALISYRLKLFGVPFRWLTEITVWEPNKRFIDTQLKGPYAKWEHEHTFSAEGGSTRMKDVVHYSPPGFFLAPLIQQLFLNKILNEVFRFRNEAIQRKFKPQELS